MAIGTNNFIDLGLKVNENDTTTKNILLVGNTKGFFGNKIEGDTIANYSSKEIFLNNYCWLEYEYNECKSNIYVIADDDTIKYYNYLIQEIANWCPGTHKKWKSISIDWYAKKYKISEDKKSIGYVNIIKELSKKRYMKFDKIIMNPPYDGNLHLKILEQAISLLKDDGNCINLSPIRWLQDPLAEYKKNSDYHRFKDVRNRIESIKIISAHDFQLMFDAVMNFDIGVYKIQNNIISKKIDIINPIIRKISNFNYNNLAPLESDKYVGIRVRIPIILGGKSGGSGKRKIQLSTLGKLYVFRDGYKDGKQWWEHYNTNQFTKRTITMGSSIEFNTEKEAENFCKQFETTLCKFYIGFAITDVNVRNSNILWMGNSINPRTGLKGYESEWTDEDFRKYFDITDSEWEEIQETMKPYM